MKISDQLKEARTRAKIPQERMAEILDIDKAHISRVERGKRGASSDLVDRWMEACEQRLVLAPKDRADLGDIETLPPEMLELLKRLARLLPVLPELFLDDLSARFTHWEGRYLSASSAIQTDSQASREEGRDVKAS